MRDHDPTSKEKKDNPPATAEPDRPDSGGPPDLSAEPLPDREEWRREAERAVDDGAWNARGAFAVEKTGDEVTRIEGWLSRPGTPRGPEDEALQRQMRREGGEHLREKTGKLEIDKPRDACHLIAVDLGGPRVDTHGEELARDNLLMGDERINRSYLAKAEGLMREALAQHGEVYCQVDVHSRRGEAPSHVTHRLFTRGEEGRPVWLGEITTTIDDRPAMTAGKAESAARKSDHRKWIH